jgi:VIT1/CCC1 family predicted Fe2+/Mn2+ transporter
MPPCFLLLPHKKKFIASIDNMKRKPKANPAAAPPSPSLLRPALLGAVDGLITSFVIIASGLAAEVASPAVLGIGLASLVADGVSMGASEVISSGSESGATVRALALKGAACFLSFVAFGACPLLVFYASPSVGPSAGAFVTLLFAIALGRSRLTREACFRSVAHVVGLGVVAGGIAYGIASASAPALARVH